MQSNLMIQVRKLWSLLWQVEQHNGNITKWANNHVI
jgi:hypothetical protein